ncbi:MAG: RrF2 family transcriptional regulator [Verrucomicrobiaceae bacterium]
MRANFYTEYAFRILLYLQLKPGERVTIREIGESFDISVNHLNKVSQRLAKMNLVTSTRGNGGGIELAPEALKIKLGDLMRSLEPTAEVAQCQGLGSQPGCVISPVCRLRGMFAEAQDAFYQNLNQRTVGDLVTGQQRQLSRLLLPALKDRKS